MIKVLENPITSNYLQFKDIVLSPTFPWLYTLSTKMPFYSHTFLERPEKGKFSNPQSELLGLNLKVLDEIIRYNNLGSSFDRCFFLRSNANAVHADTGEQFSEPHIDHRFPHYNLLVYLSGDGETIVEDEKFFPQPDNVILFTGEHYMKRPSVGRRVVLISTIFEVTGYEND